MGVTVWGGGSLTRANPLSYVLTRYWRRWRLETVLDRIDTKIADLQATRRHIVEVMTVCDNGTCTFQPSAPVQV